MALHPATRLLRDVARVLRREVPIRRPVVVRRARVPPGRVAEAQRNYARPLAAWVTIAPDLEGDELVDAVIHEWAHLRAWDLHGRRIEDHGPEWGAAYAEVYTAYWSTQGGA